MGSKKIFFFMLILLSFMLVLWFYRGSENQEVIDYQTFLECVRNPGQIVSSDKNPLIIYENQKISGKYRTRDGEKRFQTTIPAIFDDGELYRLLTTAQPPIYFKGSTESNQMMSMVLLNFAPILILGLMLWFMMRQFHGGGSNTMNFGKSRARKFDPKDKVTFDNVAGVDEAKEELKEIVDFLKEPGKFTKIGAKIPKGVLLVGPPGTGKTLLARAIAGEAGVSFFFMSGSDFVEMFVGVGASRVRDLFEQGRRNSPCILFIDEIDAVGRTRGAGMGGGHDEREQTLNQLLVEMDGFDPSMGVILVAATNRPDVLDPALLRPGRFDRQVVVDNPDVKGREAILRIHMKKIALSKNIDVAKIARATPGFSGADLANLVNEAALLAARANRNRVGMADFEEARDKAIMGVARRSKVITDHDKKITAYHEAGHTILTLISEYGDPLHKVTVIPRGMAAGVTFTLPDDNQHVSKNKLLDQIFIFLGGRAAEALIFGDVCTGASNDISNATDIARKMVTQWGMSDKVGPICYGQKDEPIFLGKEIATHKDYSDKTAQLVDEEIHGIIAAQYERAIKVLTEQKDKLILLSETLFEKETLDAKEIMELTGLYQKNYNPDLLIYDAKNNNEVKENITSDENIVVEENSQNTTDVSDVQKDENSKE
ncbi:MAG: ATP-dependent zinc metalloprotease FtsH [Spirochaetales bacterium]|nr:ATP-dependent zinc metalloprotease FtsH [Spirochaetales bacterium]